MEHFVQAYFYIDLVFEIDAAGPDAFRVGLLAGVPPGIIYASRVAFACFAFPWSCSPPFDKRVAVPIAGAVLTPSPSILRS